LLDGGVHPSLFLIEEFAICNVVAITRRVFAVKHQRM
jgi:hypothetical protein